MTEFTLPFLLDRHTGRMAFLMVVFLLGFCDPCAAERDCRGKAAGISGTWRGELDHGEESRLRLLDSDSTHNAVAIELIRPLDAISPSGEALLSLCPQGDADDFVIEQPAPNRLVLRPKQSGQQAFGDLMISVASQDRKRPAGAIKIMATFARRSRPDKEVEEIEIEPDLWQCELQDDHGDFPSCATLLGDGGESGGVIANAWGDDTDMFSFELAERRLVVIESTGADLVAGLLDAAGQLLAVDDDGGPGRGFRLVRALLPGRYIVQIEGSAGAEGGYRITLETRRW